MNLVKILVKGPEFEPSSSEMGGEFVNHYSTMSVDN